MGKFPPTHAGLAAMLQASGITLSDEQLAQLWRYHQLLHERTDDGDLTRLRAFDTMVSLHYVDCLLVAQKLAGRLPSPLLDIGSGAGLPGVPLKIGSPSTTVICNEMRAKRIAFIDEAIQTCGLQGISTWHATLGHHFDDAVGGVFTRAFEKIPVTLTRVRRMVQPGGLAIFMKGPNCDDEIAEAQASFASTWRLRDDLAYDIPFTTHRRRLVTFERLADPTEVGRRKTRRIESGSNDAMRTWRDLLTGKGIRKHGLALVAGSKLVPEVLRDFEHLCVELLVPLGTEHVVAEASADLPVALLAPDLFRELDQFGTKGPLVVVRAPQPRPWPGTLQGATLAVPFQDPENVGAVLRSAAALGVREVVLTREAASPFHPKAVRAGGLAAWRLNLWSGASLAEVAAALPAEQLVALSAEGTPLQKFVFPDDFLLLPGVEGPGLPADLRAQSVAIGMADGSESLNGPVAVAIALYRWGSQSAE
ncbi:MAG: class I SAM-dependent methyltransferase [Deltaproteobacteria bacterium]|nr:class I SAM-dependent methyltransferase [Deltaproteobacteria bacterium]